MGLERINPENVWPVPGYSHVVKAGNTIYIAGQVARKSDGSVVGSDIETQTDQVFQNLLSCLHSAGAGVEDLVKITVYLTDRNDTPRFMAVKDKYLTNNLPTQTVLIVGLGPEFKLEVEAIAVIS